MTVRATLHAETPSGDEPLQANADKELLVADGDVLAAVGDAIAKLIDILGRLPVALASGSLKVREQNQPSEYPLPAGQVDALTPPGTVSVSNMIPAVETGLAKTADVEAVRDRLPQESSRVAVAARDKFTDGEVLDDQGGAAGVLTFTFAAPVDLVWVRSDGGNSRADPFGGTPGAATGIVCEDGVPNPLTVSTSEVNVFAPSGATVSVWGFRY